MNTKDRSTYSAVDCQILDSRDIAEAVGQKIVKWLSSVPQLLRHRSSHRSSHGAKSASSISSAVGCQNGASRRSRPDNNAMTESRGSKFEL